MTFDDWKCTPPDSSGYRVSRCKTRGCWYGARCSACIEIQRRGREAGERIAAAMAVPR